MISKSTLQNSLAFMLIFLSLRLGATICPDAIQITSFPVINQSLVCGSSNDLNSTTVPAPCGSASNSYKNGLEALYKWTPSTSGTYQISYSGQTWSAIFVYQGCPNMGGTCVGSIGSSANSKTLTVNLTGSVEYFIWFDTWPSPPSPCPGTFSIDFPPPPPANDECANAIAFSPIPTDGSCSTVMVNTNNATQSQPACSGTANDDVWYTFTVPIGFSQINYSTTNISGSTDRIFQLFDSCGGTSLFCSDPESGSWAGLVGGTTYVLRVHTWASGANSTFNLCLSVPPPPPANDLCNDAIELICSVTSGSTVGSTTTGNPGTCGTTMTSGTVWYTFEGNGQMVTINTCNNTNFDTKLYVFSGSCSSLTCVTGNDDACGTRSQVSFMANTGTTYYIIVGGFGSATGNFELSLSHPVTQTFYKDADGDGYSDGTTLDDCVPPVDYYLASQLIATNGDCDDNDPLVNPGATEICNGIDDNCDGNIDDVLTTYYADQDSDGFGDPNTTTTVASCIPPAGYVSDNSDNCPLDPGKINPGVCGCGVADTDTDGDGTADCIDACPADPNKTAPGQCGCGVVDTDTDADGTADCIDECPNDPSLQVAPTWYEDADGDGFGNNAVSLQSCVQPSGHVANNLDCNDSNPSINPNATELCNGIDDNCDGAVDEGCTNPNMVVRGNGVVISNGDNTPSSADLTDFGVVVLNNNRSRTFLITNTGSDPLTLTGTPRVSLTGPDASHFTVTIMPSAQINPSNSSQFRVRFNATEAGIFTATVSIANNDINKNPYTFDIKATVNPGVAQVRGNNKIIANGDSTPSTSDFTDFGSRNVGQSLTRNFYLRNIGSGTLAVTGTPRVQLSGPGAAHFSVITQPVAFITAGGSSLFRIKFTPTAPGVHTALVSIENSDSGNDPYIFTIQGTANSSLVKVTSEDDLFRESEILTEQRNLPDTKSLSAIIYPNPAKDVLVLNIQSSADNIQMTILNIDGRIVVPTRFVTNGESISIGELPSGLYQVQFKTEDSIDTQRFIKID